MQNENKNPLNLPPYKGLESYKDVNDAYTAMQKHDEGTKHFRVIDCTPLATAVVGGTTDFYETFVMSNILPKDTVKGISEDSFFFKVPEVNVLTPLELLHLVNAINEMAKYQYNVLKGDGAFEKDMLNLHADNLKYNNLMLPQVLPVESIHQALDNLFNAKTGTAMDDGKVIEDAQVVMNKTTPYFLSIARNKATLENALTQFNSEEIRATFDTVTNTDRRYKSQSETYLEIIKQQSEASATAKDGIKNLLDSLKVKANPNHIDADVMEEYGHMGNQELAMEHSKLFGTDIRKFKQINTIVENKFKTKKEAILEKVDTTTASKMEALHELHQVTLDTLDFRRNSVGYIMADMAEKKSPSTEMDLTEALESTENSIKRINEFYNQAKDELLYGNESLTTRREKVNDALDQMAEKHKDMPDNMPEELKSILKRLTSEIQDKLGDRAKIVTNLDDISKLKEREVCECVTCQFENAVKLIVEK